MQPLLLLLVLLPLLVSSKSGALIGVYTSPSGAEVVVAIDPLSGSLRTVAKLSNNELENQFASSCSCSNDAKGIYYFGIDAGGQGTLYAIDVRSGKILTQAGAPGKFYSLAYDPKTDKIYGLALYLQHIVTFWSIDPVTLQQTQLNSEPFGISWGAGNGGAYDPASLTYYALVTLYNNSVEIAPVSVTTGQPTSTPVVPPATPIMFDLYCDTNSGKDAPRFLSLATAVVNGTYYYGETDTNSGAITKLYDLTYSSQTYYVTSSGFSSTSRRYYQIFERIVNPDKIEWTLYTLNVDNGQSTSVVLKLEPYAWIKKLQFVGWD